MTEVRIGKFEVVRRLGRGGMGTVYEGYDRSLDRRVAIKTLTLEALSDEDSRRRFEREARAAARLQHPNIVTIHELGNFGGQGRPYIVMEYLGGADLSALIKKEKRIPLTVALGIAAELCRALDFAHQKAVVHRDVKPSNIRYLDDDRIKIMDFGIARMEGTGQITRSGVMIGTLHYMSPEQIQGKGVDGRSDIFSTGCILYEMLAGSRPFDGQSATAILYKIVHEPAPTILETNPDLPEQAQEILNRALAKMPDDRYQTAREMARDLEKLQQILRRSFPRPSPELQSRLNEVGSLRRQGNWSDIVPLAEKILAERPDLEGPWRAYHHALEELHRKEEATQLKPEEKSRQMLEIDREIQLLSPAAKTADKPEIPPTLAEEGEAVEEREDQTIPVTQKERTTRPSSRLGWVASFAVVLAMAAGIGWLALRRSAAPEPFQQTVFISSEPAGSFVFVDGNNRGLVTQAEGFVELSLEGAEGDVFSIELRKDGYTPGITTVTLTSSPPSPIQLSLEPRPEELVIRTEPPGVTIGLDEEQLDDTIPVDVAASPQEEHELVVSEEGHRSESRTISPDEGPAPDPIVVSAEAAPAVVDSEDKLVVVEESSPPDLAKASEVEGEQPSAKPQEPVMATEPSEPSESPTPDLPPPSTEVRSIPEEPAEPPAQTIAEEAQPVAPERFGMLSVRSEYPLSVLSAGDSIAESSRDPTVELKAGRHEIILLAPEVFLNQTTTVEVHEDRTTHFFAPALGTASIRSFPENGRLSINGIRARDLPLVDLPIVAGSHTFLFQWPDGSRYEQIVVVKTGERVYVTGQIR